MENRTLMFLRALALSLLVFPAFVSAQPPSTTLTVDWAAQQNTIAPNFSGLSFETELVLPNRDGVHYFRADNQPLIQLFRTLGIKHIRIGGNTSDNPAVSIPDDVDIDSLFGFARAAGVKVVYTVRLKGQKDASADVPICKYIEDHYASDLDCFAIGNEPSIYYKQYSQYRDLWKMMTSQILAAVPQAVFCGPNTDRHYEWAVQFADDFANSGRVKEINEHAYVGLSARKVTDVAAARDKMLSNDWVKLYQGVYDGFAPQVMRHNLPYRLEETNTFFNGGKEGASDTFAAALWGVDYMYWWASHQASGINFHTGDKVAAGSESTPCRYAAYVSTPDGYDVHPLGYAIKVFDLGGHGTLVPVQIESPDNLNITAYGVVGADNSLSITAINKEHGPAGRDAEIAIDPGKPFLRGEVIFLTNATHDIADKTGITLGGAPISSDASWAGKWTTFQPMQTGEFVITIPAASAAVIKLLGS